ncbi:hypothetical protein [Novosphingobium rosa]|uniref:hypothetical protein n=1 Tax=Novosphingobium rosa TaxID=76978 RepID=UPI00082AF58E|nr:hypothetical protein [Novosphingobium rosa]
MANRPKLSLFRNSANQLPQASPAGRKATATVTDGAEALRAADILPAQTLRYQQEDPAARTVKFKVAAPNGGGATAERPATLEGFKRRAKKLRKAEGITHNDALEQFARTCGFKSYQTALGFYRQMEVANG